MKLACIVTVVLAFPLMAAGQQRTVTVAPAASSQSTMTSSTAPAFPFPGGFNPPAGMFEQFWNDPACAAELRLTDTQRKQLQDAALNQRLSFIDGSADALKAVTRLSAILDADQLDDAAYKEQMNNLAAATGKLVQDLGEMVVSPRRVLTAEQWKKLQAFQRAKRSAAKPAASAHQPGTHAPATGDKP